MKVMDADLMHIIGIISEKHIKELCMIICYHFVVNINISCFINKQKAYLAMCLTSSAPMSMRAKQNLNKRAVSLNASSPKCIAIRTIRSKANNKFLPRSTKEKKYSVPMYVNKQINPKGLKTDTHIPVRGFN